VSSPNTRNAFVIGGFFAVFGAATSLQYGIAAAIEVGGIAIAAAVAAVALVRAIGRR
jgi:hypothetical protein